MLGLVLKVFGEPKEAPDPNRRAVTGVRRATNPQAFLLARHAKHVPVEVVGPDRMELTNQVVVQVPLDAIPDRLESSELKAEVEFNPERVERPVGGVNAQRGDDLAQVVVGLEPQVAPLGFSDLPPGTPVGGPVEEPVQPKFTVPVTDDLCESVVRVDSPGGDEVEPHPHPVGRFDRGVEPLE